MLTLIITGAICLVVGAIWYAIAHECPKPETMYERLEGLPQNCINNDHECDFGQHAWNQVEYDYELLVEFKKRCGVK